MRILWFMKKQLDVAVDRTVRLEMMRALEDLGHEVVLVTGYRKERERFGFGESIRFLDTVSLPFLFHMTFMSSLRNRLLDLLEEIKPDVVVLDPWTAWAAAMIARRVEERPRVIVDVRTLPVQLKGLRKVLSEVLFRRGIEAATAHADGVSVITEPMREILITEYGLDAGMPCAIWSSGVNTESFSPERVSTSESSLVRSACGLADGDFVIMYHGTLTRSRGLLNLVDSMDIVRKSIPGARLLLVGRGLDVEDILCRVEKLGLQDVVGYVGAVPHSDIPRYVASCDVGILPFPDYVGWRVSSPIKLMEYLAMERPVVVTDIVAHRTVLGASGVGFYAADSRASSLAAAIMSAWKSGSDGRLQAGRIGRTLVASQFTWDAQARKMAGLMKVVTG